MKIKLSAVACVHVEVEIYMYPEQWNSIEETRGEERRRLLEQIADTYIRQTKNEGFEEFSGVHLLNQNGEYITDFESEAIDTGLLRNDPNN